MFDPSGGLDDLERAVDKVIASDQLVELPRLRKLCDRLEAAWVRSVRAAERAGEFADAHRATAGVLAEQCGLPQHEARRAVELGRKLEALPEVAKAFAAGELSPAQVAVLARGATPKRIKAFRDVQAQLVALAQQCSLRQLRGAMQRYCDAVDGDGGASAAERARKYRYVYLSAAFERVGVLQGELEPEATEWVLKAFEHRMSVDPARGRTSGQRRADALVDICKRYLATLDAPVAPVRARIGAVVDVRVLRAQGHGTIVDAIHGDLEATGAVYAETLRRLACDADIHRIITDGPSLVLDVGESEGIPVGLWRALVARDGGCVGCGAPPGECQVHHRVHRFDHGPTNLENCELRCHSCHFDEHEGRRARARAPT